MGKIVVTTFVTLDGVIESPHEWCFPFWSDEVARFKQDELFAADAHLIGRLTYESFAAAWPSRTDDDGFADRMNSLPKFVVSRTLKEATWQNSTLISDDIAGRASALKQQFAADILVSGSAALVRALMRANLVDEYRLLLFPVVVGRGKRLFAEGDQATLTPAETRTFGSGIVLLRYHPVPMA